VPSTVVSLPREVVCALVKELVVFRTSCPVTTLVPLL
jgi:hypothetical protein